MKRSAIFIVGSVFLLLLSSLITINEGYSLLRRSYLDTIGYKQSLLDKIDMLTVGASIDFFKSVFGEPVFINSLSENYMEYIFVNDYFFLQAIINNSDNKDKVFAYSVTVREKNFYPKLRVDMENIILGKTKFAELDKFSSFRDGINYYVGAHNCYYNEIYFFGNPGGYLTYAFSVNQSGLGYGDNIPVIHANQIDISDSEVKKFRETNSMNTFTVIKGSPLSTDASNRSVSSYEFIFGPSFNDVRILPGFFK